MKSISLRKTLIFTAFAGLLSACSMNASIQSLVPTATTLTASSQAQGIASGAGQAKVTNTGNYSVSSAAGMVGGSNTTNNSMVTTTSGGYQVYSTVQGAIISQ